MSLATDNPKRRFASDRSRELLVPLPQMANEKWEMVFAALLV